MYDTFLQRYRETKQQEDIQQPDVRVVTVAAPPTAPSSLGWKVFTAAGFTASFVLSSVLALVLDRLDRGIRSSREVESMLGLQTLAMVPKLDRLKRNQKLHQYLREKPLSSYAEQIRAVFTALKSGAPGQPQPKVFLVTSSLPEEGKTALVVSLATLAARSNKKVLIIDLDLRHPSVHRELGWQVSAGIVEYMSNERSLEEVIHHDLETGLHFLPVKTQTTNPVDLIESERMRQLVDVCRANYDYVIIELAAGGQRGRHQGCGPACRQGRVRRAVGEDRGKRRTRQPPGPARGRDRAGRRGADADRPAQARPVWLRRHRPVLQP